MALDGEILHIAGGFILGAGAYQYFVGGKEKKPNYVMLILAGFAGWLFVEFVLHGLVG